MAMPIRQMKIIPGAPLAAIYTRKSKATETGESIENQIARCIALCESKGWGYIVYVDYDFSGGSTDRPDFNEMMKKVRNNEFDYVVVYHIYRFARNMKDFTVLMDEFQDLEIGFVSISQQQFDTSTPMGRAAMYMAAVFGQLEREDGAEQVKDNMIFLAQKGRWNGGPVPYGFDTYSKLIDYRNGEGKKKVTYLIINEEESEKIKKFYESYLVPGGSIRSVVTKANELGYKTKNGAYWSHSQMSRILQNPLYCIADENSYDYFKNNTEVNMVDAKDAYNGKNGLMYYNRRRKFKKTTRLRDESEWILSIGEHKGFIPGEIFARVQHKLNKNKSEAPRTGQSLRSALVGLVRCGRCGSSMSIFGSPKDSNNRQKGYYHYFRCLTREQQARVLCDNENVRADKLEDLVISNITSLLNNKKSLQAILEAANNDIEDNRTPLVSRKDKLKKELGDLDTEINNLVDALSKDILPELVIRRKYKELENKKTELRKELNQIEYELIQNNYVESFDIDTIYEYVKDFRNTYEYLDLEGKKGLLNSIVKEVIVNKNKVNLVLYFLPGQEYDCQSDCLRTDKDSC
ncbi:MAG: recombinase family protein [Tissierellaceae bacterium]